MIRVAILHYHLRPGGVTRVIEMAWAALQGQGVDVLVISGEPPPAETRIPASSIQVVPELRYGVSSSEAENLRLAIEAAERRHWQASADVLHFHNHGLGKNFALPLAITAWAQAGRRILLNIHDFAENGRPANYLRLLAELGGTAGLARCLYPVAPQVGYAVLTTHDAIRLRRGGLTDDVTLLPNPVALPTGSEAIPRSMFAADRLVVYPTRSIRRKNIGEALLWAAWSEPDELVILTCAPVEGLDVVRHAEWEAFAERLGLRVLFRAQKALDRSTADFLLTADLCLTTSVAEGFGMAFLEPWLAGSPLAGRDLPSVTTDFRQAGVALDPLYPRLDVDARSISAESVREDIEGNIRHFCAAYEVDFEAGFVESAFQSVWQGGSVDFGRVGEPHQRLIIEEVVRSGQKRQLKADPGAVDRNRATIQAEFSLEKYGERLMRAYRGLVEVVSETPDFLDPRGVLQASLAFEDYFATRNL